MYFRGELDFSGGGDILRRGSDIAEGIPLIGGPDKSQHLSTRTLQLCIPFPAPVSTTTLEFPLLYLRRDHLLARLFLDFGALPQRINERSMVLFPGYFLLDSLLYFCLLFFHRFDVSYYSHCKVFVPLLCPVWSFLVNSTSPLFSPTAFGSFTISCPCLSSFRLELRHGFAFPIATHTPHPSLLAHADTF